MKSTLTVVGVALLFFAGLVHSQQLLNSVVPLFTPVDITADITELGEKCTEVFLGNAVGKIANIDIHKNLV